MAATLLLTRPLGAAQRFLDGLGVETPHLISPIMRIVPLTPQVLRVPKALVLTSENGAAALARLDLPPGLPAWCVGLRTAEVARANGADAIVAGPDAAHLLPRILAEGGNGPFLHLRGAHVAADVAVALQSAGRVCDALVVYDQQDCPLSPAALALLDGTAPVVLPLFSPRSAALVAKAGPFAAPLIIVAISPAAAALAPSAARVYVAPTPELSAMQRLVAQAVGEAG